MRGSIAVDRRCRRACRAPNELSTMTTTSPLAELQDALFRAADALRDEFLAAAFTDAIGSFMLLKLVEEELAAEEQGLPCRPFGPNLFARQAARFRWSRWRGLPESDLAAFVDDEVFPYLASLVREAPLLASYFQGFRLELRLGSIVRRIADALDEVQLRSLPPAVCAEALTSVFLRYANGAEFSTPGRVCDLMVELANPQRGETVFDPCCGAGAVLGGVLEFIGRNDPSPDAEGNRVDGVCSGIEVNAVSFRVATLQLALRGVRTKSIKWANALKSDGSMDPTKSYDLVMVDPPLGGRLESAALRAEVAPFARHSESAFLALAMGLVAPRGRIVAALPLGTLFRSDLATRQLRRLLLERFHVRAVVKLAPGAYAPLTSIPMSVIVAEPRGVEEQPGFVQFVELGSDDFASPGTTAEQLSPNRYAEFVQAFRAASATRFEAPVGTEGLSELPPGSPEPLTWWASEETVRAHDDVLAPEHYRPSIADAPELRDPKELLRQALERQREVVRGIETLLGELERDR